MFTFAAKEGVQNGELLFLKEVVSQHSYATSQFPIGLRAVYEKDQQSTSHGRVKRGPEGFQFMSNKEARHWQHARITPQGAWSGARRRKGPAVLR